MIIDQLTPTVSDNLTDEVPVEQGTATFKTTWQKILNLFKGNITASDIPTTNGNVQTDIGDMVLTTTATDLSGAVNELGSDIGSLSSDKAEKDASNINATDFRSALGLGTGGTLPITIAQGGTGSTSIEETTTISDVVTAAADFTVNSVVFEKWGNVANLYIQITKATAVTTASNMSMATLKAGFRPTAARSPLMGMSSTIGFGSITESGTLIANGTWAAGASKYFVATYLVGG